MAVSVFTDLASAQNSRTLSWTITSLALNDVVVVCAHTWDQPDTLGTPSGTGLSFTLRAEVNSAGSHTHAYIWTAVASSGGSSVVVTATAGSSSIHTGVLYQCPTADGYSLAATPNTFSGVSAGAGSAPTGSVTSTAGSLILANDGDWDGAATAPTYTGGGAEDGRMQSSGNSSHYYFHYTAAGSSTTIGMSAPLQRWSLAGMEVLKSAGASTTRGTPFGHRGTAFNGGRTFHGIINREAAWQARLNSSRSGKIITFGRGLELYSCLKRELSTQRAPQSRIILPARYLPASSLRTPV